MRSYPGNDRFAASFGTVILEQNYCVFFGAQGHSNNTAEMTTTGRILRALLWDGISTHMILCASVYDSQYAADLGFGRICLAKNILISPRWRDTFWKLPPKLPSSTSENLRKGTAVSAATTGARGLYRCDGDDCPHKSGHETVFALNVLRIAGHIKKKTTQT